MAFFMLNWNLQGFRDKMHEAGDVIEADLDEVKHWIEKKHGGTAADSGDAVMVPVEAATPEGEQTGSHADVDLEALTKAQIVAHAAEHHDLTLDPATKKPELIQAVEAARAATPEGEQTAQ
jgi:hypothetical protein